MNKIIFDISGHSYAKRITSREFFLQQPALERLEEVLERVISESLSLANSPNPIGYGSANRRRSYDDIDSDQFYVPHRVHNSIAILGARGTGKSTFLLSILSSLTFPGQGLFYKEGNNNSTFQSQRYCNLGVIDPTLISEKHNLFLAIISRIQAKVVKSPRWREDRLKNEWLDSLRSLAGGLSTIEGIGAGPLQNRDWEDEVYIMEEGLKRVESGLKLEISFHEFLVVSLRLLSADTFVLGVDDMDTAFDCGWQILETLRRYLTSPLLIVLIAGDMKLFTALVRRHQWQQLGDLATKYERNKRDYYRYFVDRLEDQYLVKILKPENRIFLDSVYRLYSQKQLTTGLSSIAVSAVEHKEERLSEEAVKNLPALEAVFSNFLESAFFIRRPPDRRLYEQALLEEPIRTIRQLLHIWKDTNKSSGKTRSQLQHEISDRIAHVLNGPLTQLGLKPLRLRNMTPVDMGMVVLRELIDRNILDPGFHMRPQFTDATINLAIIGLGARLSSMMAEHPRLAINYMIKVCLTHHVYMLVTPAKRPDHIKAYVRYTVVDQAESSFSVAARASAFLRTNYSEEKKCEIDEKFSHLGTIMLRNRKTSSDPLFNTTDANLKPKGILERIMFSLPMEWVCQQDGKKIMVLSIYNLIAAISNILGCNNEDEIFDLLMRRAVPQVVQIPPDASGISIPSTPPTCPVLGNDTTDNDSSRVKDFAKALDKWRIKANEIALNNYAEALSICAVPKMWNWMINSIQEIDASYIKDGSDKKAGRAFQKIILAFLNAVLVEGAEYSSGGRRGLSYNNGSEIEEIIVNNLRMIKNKINHDTKPNKCALYLILATCPLLPWYLISGEYIKRKDRDKKPIVNLQRYLYGNIIKDCRLNTKDFRLEKKHKSMYDIYDALCKEVAQKNQNNGNSAESDASQTNGAPPSPPQGEIVNLEDSTTSELALFSSSTPNMAAVWPIGNQPKLTG